jgi:predicted RNase H-like HicB family nuclease
VSKQEVHAVIFRDAANNKWVAMCLEYDIVTQADDYEHARERIQEAVQSYLSYATSEELQVLYQRAEGDLKLEKITVDVPTSFTS